jgi:hypothetical protein
MITTIEKELVKRSPSSDTFGIPVKKKLMRKSVSCCNLMGKDKTVHVKSIGHERSFSLHDLVNTHKDTVTNFIKANAGGVCFDLAKDAFSQEHANISNTIADNITDSIVQESIVSTISHIIQHHHV